jgi:hypothetical protein
MTVWGRGCKAYIVAPNGVRPGASAAGPYTRRGTGILPVMFMARMAMPRLELRLRRFALPALDGHAKAAPNMGPDDEPRRRPEYVHLCIASSCILFLARIFARIVGPNGVRPGASAAGPYTRRGTGILPVMFMARMAMPRLGLRLRRFALAALTAVTRVRATRFGTSAPGP